MLSKVSPSFLIQLFAGLIVVWGFSYSQTAIAQISATNASCGTWGVVVKPRDPREIVRVFDENGDGKIDQTEYSTRIVNFFLKLDKKKNDFLTPDEVSGLGKDQFDEIDQNKDGKLSTYELLTAKSMSFGAIDTNSDRYITIDEIAAKQKCGAS